MDAAHPHPSGDQHQVVNEQVRRRISAARVAGHHLLHHRRQLSRYAAVFLRGIGRFLALMVQQLLQDRSFRVGWLAGQHVVQRAAERIDIAADVDVARVFGLLGRDVIEGAQRRAGQSDVAFLVGGFLSRQPHVDQFCAAFGRDDNVRRLDVAMDHAGRRRVLQRRRDLQSIVDGFRRFETAVLLNQVTDVRPGHMLVGDEVQAVVFAHEEDAGDVVVVQPGGGAGLVLKSLNGRNVARLRGGQHLQGHDTLQALIDGPKNGPHSADPNSLFDDEMPQLHPGRTDRRFRRLARHCRFDSRFRGKQPSPNARGAGLSSRTERNGISAPFRIHDGFRTLRRGRGRAERKGGRRLFGARLLGIRGFAHDLYSSSASAFVHDSRDRTVDGRHVFHHFLV